MPRTQLQDAEHRSVEQRSTLKAMRPRPKRREQMQEGLDRLSTAATSRRALNAVLSSPCTRHGARAGRGCWEMPRGIDPTGRTTYPAVCAARVGAVFSEVTR